jgi:predicted nucleic acid-binding protein
VALTHLVDTSVLKRLSAVEVRAALEPLVDQGRVGRSTVSDLEVGYSASNDTEWDDLVGALDVFQLIETTTEDFTRAKQVQRVLATRRQRGRKIPDLLIAAAAESRRLTVLHYDRDFDLIASATGQPTQWIVPPGSVD